ncbi:MAG: aminotransferase class III-fold pyridoxal phosphate-dependent enzyme [Cyclobacteriaceae bacterium]|nr:aminotransferase class III-fold pyridoxal phosphate-dependent enzyme [Cyclobacteriaceae bacterium]
MTYSPEDAAHLIRTHFSLQGELTPLPGEIDLNYRLEASDGGQYTFKIANSNEKLENLEFQNALMKHLNTAGLGLDIPKVVNSITGNPILTIKEGDRSRFIRLLTWVEGRPLAKVNPHSTHVLRQLGSLVGSLSKALQDFSHPASDRFIKWDVARLKWIEPHVAKMKDNARKDLLNHFLLLHRQWVLPIESSLRKSVIYNDANDYNVLVSHDPIDPVIPSVIDFGDAVYSHTVNDLAIAMAYGLMHKPDPLGAAFHIVKGYHEIFPLQDEELKALFSLTAARLQISVVCSEINREEEPDNIYLQISDQGAWDLLEKMKGISPSLAYFTFRNACGLAAHPSHQRFTQWASTASLHQLVKNDPVNESHSLDLSVGSLDLGDQNTVLDSQRLHYKIAELINSSGKKLAIGKYNEPRPFYTSQEFNFEGNEGPEWRTVHIGLDLFLPAGETVFAPIDGEVVSASDNAGDRNYGPTVILKHDILPELTFYTLYGHLSRQSIKKLKPGDKLTAGSPIATLGDLHENGGWSPHLHFQIMLDLLDNEVDFPGVARPSVKEIWTSICPDPWWLIASKPSSVTEPRGEHELRQSRSKHLGKNLSLSYQRPLQMVRGFRQHLYDATGRKYLDTVNNVAHVGHEHPRVVAAGQRQMAVLNTNTRYLHKNVIEFTEELLKTFPDELSVAYLVNSGSEANELALRMAKTYTNRKDMIVVEVGYHGNTNACVEISSYKFDGKGGKGPSDHIHVVPIPDIYRGKYASEPDAGKKYAVHIDDAIKTMKAKGTAPAAFICESILSCGGQVVLPESYLKEAYRTVRAAGGVCIADEVQTGCGRVGTHFWAFETQGVTPDIVTIGKPIGNGHPLGVVVTTRSIADAFANGMEYFNTFGGNPVSSAIGLEVLKVIKDEGQQANAVTAGTYLTDELNKLKKQHTIIGDVRGMGLFLGIELVLDKNKTPGTKQASYLANRMRELGILMSTDGPYENVLKIKPPMVFESNDADFLLSTLDRVLKEDFLKI